MHDQQADQARNRDPHQTEGCQQRHHSARDSAACNEPQQAILHLLHQQAPHQAGDVPLACGRNQPAQRHDEPVGQRKHQSPHRVGKRHTLPLHVQAQQASTGQQPTNDIEQQSSDLIQHGNPQMKGCPGGKPAAPWDDSGPRFSARPPGGLGHRPHPILTAGQPRASNPARPGRS